MIVIVEQNCTVEFRGRAFSAGGAVISPNDVVAYPHFPNGEHVGATGTVDYWHGGVIGTARIVAKWRMPKSWMSSHMFQIECCIDGVLYTGRGMGSNMYWRGKPKANQNMNSQRSD